MVPILLSSTLEKELWRAGVGVLASITWRRCIQFSGLWGIFFSASGFYLGWCSCWLWARCVVRRASFCEQILETGYVNVSIACSVWAAVGLRVENHFWCLWIGLVAMVRAGGFPDVLRLQVVGRQLVLHVDWYGLRPVGEHPGRGGTRQQGDCPQGQVSVIAN